MLNSYFLKKYGTFSIYFFLNKMPHSILPGTAAHFVFKSQACDLHTNFLIKSLSKGKDSCHADRQLTKQFYCFFPRKRVRKTRKSQLGRANSQYTTYSAAAIIWTFPGQPNQVIKQKFGLILRTSPLAWNVWSSIESQWSVRSHTGEQPLQP